MPPVAYVDESGLRDYRAAVAISTTPAPRWPWLVLLAFLLGLLCGARAASAAEPCVRLQVRPRILLFRGDVDVQARVARHVDHRRLLVAWDSDQGAAGSRLFSLEGDHDRVLFQWWNRDQPPAHYAFEARVYDDHGKQVGFDRAEIQTASEGP